MKDMISLDRSTFEKVIRSMYFSPVSNQLFFYLIFSAEKKKMQKILDLLLREKINSNNPSFLTRKIVCSFLLDKKPRMKPARIRKALSFSILKYLSEEELKKFADYLNSIDPSILSQMSSLTIFDEFSEEMSLHYLKKGYGREALLLSECLYRASRNCILHLIQDNKLKVLDELILKEDKEKRLKIRREALDYIFKLDLRGEELSSRLQVLKSLKIYRDSFDRDFKSVLLKEMQRNFSSFVRSKTARDKLRRYLSLAEDLNLEIDKVFLEKLFTSKLIMPSHSDKNDFFQVREIAKLFFPYCMKANYWPKKSLLTQHLEVLKKRRLRSLRRNI